MSVHAPAQFKLTEGLDAYNPEVTGKDLFFLYLNSVEPKLGRLYASLGHSVFQQLENATSDRIISFGYYQLRSRQFYELYAFSRTKVYRFNFATGLFNTAAIYSSFYSSDDPYVIIPWYDCMYVTKLYSPYVKIERDTVTVIADAPYARYGIVANGHVYLAGVGDTVTNELARVRWSDLDDPESFAIDPNSSEADFFDLEPDSREITGVSYQRGVPLTYAQNNIWAGTPIGFPGGFRHDPIIPGVGNIFHGALVHNKEVDYFIGDDNIYALNGLQLVPIGSEIYQRFIGDVKKTNPYVRGYIDTRANQVFWIYLRTNDTYWSIVYNYLEKKWCERDPQNVTAWFDAPRTSMRGFDTIDEMTEFVNTNTDLIDDPDAGYAVTVPQLAAANVSNANKVLSAHAQKLKADGTSFSHKIETFDFFFETIGEVNEVTKALIELTKGGTPNVALRIGVRDNQADAVVWSASTALDSSKSTLSFFTRSIGVGRYLRFEFTWTNTAANYVTDLRLLSLMQIEDNDTPEV